MDTLAYTHLASTYESPTKLSLNKNLVLFRGVNWSNVSNACWMPIVAVAISLSVMSISQPANASLSYGDSGYGVKKVQNALADYGYFHGKSTGYYGSMTKHAVKAFQADYGLSVDGVVGPATAAALGVHHQPSHHKPSYEPASYHGCHHSCGGGNDLSYGDKSYSVKQLQYRLANLGYFDANATGYYGSITKHAVKAFQADCGLKVDGIAGPSTLAALGI